jgi:translation initiation factor IF-3
MAEEAGLDLVEIAPMAVPPVCKLMDFGKFKYQEQKKAHEAKLKQKQMQVKEVKLRPGTDENDYQIKLRNLKRFLEEGDKAKVTLRFRGREMAHQEFGLRQLERVKATSKNWSGRADAQDGRPPDDHGARAEEEALSFFLKKLAPQGARPREGISLRRKTSGAG